MALFDRSEEESDGEVRISMNDGDQNEGKLKDEAEERLTEKSGDSKSTSESSSDSGSMLPGVSSSGTSSSSPAKNDSVSQKDIHDQNKEIIELLNDIKKEVSSGGSNELL